MDIHFPSVITTAKEQEVQLNVTESVVFTEYWVQLHDEQCEEGTRRDSVDM